MKRKTDATGAELNAVIQAIKLLIGRKLTEPELNELVDFIQRCVANDDIDDEEYM